MAVSAPTPLHRLVKLLVEELHRLPFSNHLARIGSLATLEIELSRIACSKRTEADQARAVCMIGQSFEAIHQSMTKATTTLLSIYGGDNSRGPCSHTFTGDDLLVLKSPERLSLLLASLENDVATYLATLSTTPTYHSNLVTGAGVAGLGALWFNGGCGRSTPDACITLLKEYTTRITRRATECTNYMSYDRCGSLGRAGHGVWLTN